MAYPRTIRNFNVFIDGVSYFGRATEGKIPDLKISTSAHRGAGMDAPVGIDTGMEAMSAEVTMAEWDPALLKKIGKIERFVFRPAAKSEEDFSADTYIATIGGLLVTNEFGGLKPGDPATLKLSIDVREYRFEQNGEVLFDIDIQNGKRIIGGVDQLAEMRNAMGL
ncbi:phage major tail tube protein [Profundibacter sp.]